MTNFRAILAAFSLVGATQIAFAESVGVKDINTSGDSNTTIEIRKNAKTIPQYDITTHNEDIEGDSNVLVAEAKVSWKQACADWKKETKEINKENSVLQLNCGKMSCARENVEYTCSSVGTAKVKVKIN